MKTKSCLLSTAYWPPVQYLSKLMIYESIIIEQFETYPKQTYRNRANIYGPNGLQSLNVPVSQGSFKKVITKDLQISYQINWQKNHLRSIEAAYRSSPFYDFYIDDIIPLFEKKHRFLLDLNNEILDLCCNWLEFDSLINYSDDFIPVTQEADYRFSIHPKSGKSDLDEHFYPREYNQVFDEKFGFIPNLSVLDLIFNLGNEASFNLKQSIK